MIEELGRARQLKEGHGNGEQGNAVGLGMRGQSNGGAGQGKAIEWQGRVMESRAVQGDGETEHGNARHERAK